MFLGLYYLLTQEIPWCFESFQRFFSVFLEFLLGSRWVKSLVFWIVFLGFYLNTKEWKIRAVHDVHFTRPPLNFHGIWKATKEYLNQRGTKIRVFRVCFRTPFLPPFFPHFSPLFPLQALCILAPLLPSSPPPSSPLFWLPEKSDLGTPLI